MRLEDADAAAVVMLSLFEEQVQHQTDTMERIMGSGEDGFAESLSHFPEHDEYQLDPDIDLENFQATPDINLSTAAEIRLPMLWLSLLYGHIKAPMAASHGIHSATEVVKCLLAGADVTMTTPALLQHGVEHLTTLVNGLQQWMQQKGYDSVRQMKGTMSQRLASDPSAFERASYIKMLEAYQNNPVQA